LIVLQAVLFQASILNSSAELDKNYEFTEFTETVKVGVCRKLWRLPWFTAIFRMCCTLMAVTQGC